MVTYGTENGIFAEVVMVCELGFLTFGRYY